jgi:tryptophanyl-tRNA synthetase
VSHSKARVGKTAGAAFKQYREKDGKFYFKLTDAKGAVLLQSVGLDSPQLAGKSIALLQSAGTAALADLAAQLEPAADVAALAAALDALRASNS